MIFLPIVARELRVTARRAKTYWSRTGVATVMLLVASWIFLTTHGQAPANQAFAMFATLAGAMLFIGGFSGLGTTADALSSEKREGTLGLLFLTPLRGYDVVLGKLCAGSLSVLYGLLGVTPLMALPMLMGGVSAVEFGRMALLILNTVLLSLAAGICVSSISRDEKRARGMTLLLMLLMAAGLPIIGTWLEHEARIHGVARWFLLFSPGYAFAGTLDSTRGLRAPWFWGSMVVIHLTTWSFLLLACWCTPRTWQDRPVQKEHWIQRWFRLGSTRTNGGGAARFRARLLDQNAFYWLVTRPRVRPFFVWMVLCSVTAVWLGLGIWYPGDMFSVGMYLVVAVTWNGILKAWVASESTRQIAVDRRSGAIELLLCTPLTVADIAAGLWLALRRQFGGPVLTVLAAECLLLVVTARTVGWDHSGVVWIAVWGCGIVMLVADLLALSVLGLWRAAVCKGPAEAAGSTAFRILALPWILYLLLGSAMVVADSFGVIRGVPRPEWVFWLGSWTLIGLTVDLVFGVRAWNVVRARFRELASQRGGVPGLGYRLGRAFGRAKASLSARP